MSIITEYLCKFWHKNFKINFVIEFYLYLIFDPSPMAPGEAKPKISVLLHTSLMRGSYKANLVGFSPTV